MTETTAHVEVTARALADVLREEGLYEVALETGREALRLRRRRTVAPPPAVVLEMGEEEESVEESLEELAAVPVTSQVVGVVHLSGNGSPEPLIRPRQRVHTGEVLAFLESMGLNHEVHCPVDGDVMEILVHEGDPVEYGQALLIVQPI